MVTRRIVAALMLILVVLADSGCCCCKRHYRAQNSCGCCAQVNCSPCSEPVACYKPLPPESVISPVPQTLSSMPTIGAAR